MELSDGGCEVAVDCSGGHDAAAQFVLPLLVVTQDAVAALLQGFCPTFTSSTVQAHHSSLDLSHTCLTSHASDIPRPTSQLCAGAGPARRLALQCTRQWGRYIACALEEVQCCVCKELHSAAFRCQCC